MILKALTTCISIHYTVSISSVIPKIVLYYRIGMYIIQIKQQIISMDIDTNNMATPSIHNDYTNTLLFLFMVQHRNARVSNTYNIINTYTHPSVLCTLQTIREPIFIKMIIYSTRVFGSLISFLSYYVGVFLLVEQLHSTCQLHLCACRALIGRLTACRKPSPSLGIHIALASHLLALHRAEAGPWTDSTDFYEHTLSERSSFPHLWTATVKFSLNNKLVIKTIFVIITY